MLLVILDIIIIRKEVKCHHHLINQMVFTLVQPYDTDPPVWHVDLYRLAGAREADALGLFETDAALLIEWPERLGAELPSETLRIRIEGSGEATRRLTAHVPGSWEGRWPPR